VGSYLALRKINNSGQYATRPAEVRDGISYFIRIDKGLERGTVVETPEFFHAAGCDERANGIKRLDPIPFHGMKIDRLCQFEPGKILGA
jgi:hypothetical protein